MKIKYLALPTIFISLNACVVATDPSAMKFKNHFSQISDAHEETKRDLDSIKADKKKIERINSQLANTLTDYQSCNSLCETKVKKLGVKVLPK